MKSINCYFQELKAVSSDFSSILSNTEVVGVNSALEIIVRAKTTNYK